MKYKKSRWWIVAGVAVAIILPFIVLPIMASTKKQSAEIPQTEIPNSPGHGNTTKPDTSTGTPGTPSTPIVPDKDPTAPQPVPPSKPEAEPTIQSINIQLNNGGNYVVGDTITATAIITPNTLKNIEYKWSIVDSSTYISNSTSSSISFEAKKEDNSRMLKVVLTHNGNNFQKEVRLNIADKTQPAPQPLPPPAPDPETPVPGPVPPPAPSPSVPPAENMNFRVDIRRTSGFKFDDASIQFKLFNDKTNEPIKNKNGSLWYSDWDDSDEGYLNLELPSDGEYRLEVGEINRVTYKYPENIKFNKNTTNIKYPFQPIILDTPKNESYRLDDVSHVLPYTKDVLDKPISLLQNSAEGKVTIIMHFKTSCPKSRRTLNMLYGAINYDINGNETREMWDKVNVICISDNDTIDDLKEYETNERLHPEFQFVLDTNDTVVDRFFHNDLSYPRLAFLDYQGVWVKRLKGEMTPDGKNSARKWINQYSKPKTTETAKFMNNVAIKKEHDE